MSPDFDYSNMDPEAARELAAHQYHSGQIPGSKTYAPAWANAQSQAGFQAMEQMGMYYFGIAGEAAKGEYFKAMNPINFLDIYVEEPEPGSPKWWERFGPMVRAAGNFAQLMGGVELPDWVHYIAPQLELFLRVSR
jgi:hypothetical protein